MESKPESTPEPKPDSPEPVIEEDQTADLSKYGQPWCSKLTKEGLKEEDVNQAHEIRVANIVKDDLQRKFKETCEFLKRMTEEDYSKFGYEKDEIHAITGILSEQTSGNFSDSSVFTNFPGANSISFDYSNMQTIQSRKTVVCEKTDGVRFFLCEVAAFQKGV